jgi:tetratricopeptide (TPR) repeat protein
VEERIAAVRKAPTDPRARFDLGMAYYEADEYEFALSELVEAIKLNPENRENLSGRANFHLGNVLLAMDRAALAANAYREALRLGWKAADVYMALGEALTSLGEIDDAIVQYQEALRVSPEAFEAYAGLGLALEAGGRLDEAVAQYERYLQSAPPTDDHGVEAIRHRLAKLNDRRRM